MNGVAIPLFFARRRAPRALAPEAVIRAPRRLGEQLRLRGKRCGEKGQRDGRQCGEPRVPHGVPLVSLGSDPSVRWTGKGWWAGARGPLGLRRPDDSMGPRPPYGP